MITRDELSATLQKHSGAYEISAMIDGHRRSKVYYGYGLEEARDLFLKEINGEINEKLRNALKGLRDAAINTPALDSSSEWTGLIEQADAALRGEIDIPARLEYLRGELRAERISYGELHELQSLAQYIPEDDTELREAAGIPEFKEERTPDMDKFTEGYIECALWAEDLDRGMHELSVGARAKMEADCQKFQTENAALLEQASEEGRADDYLGHDFWLTRNRHGAGFWDGDLSKELGKQLTDASHKFGECNLYVSDAGEIEID